MNYIYVDNIRRWECGLCPRHDTKPFRTSREDAKGRARCLGPPRVHTHTHTQSTCRCIHATHIEAPLKDILSSGSLQGGTRHMSQDKTLSSEPGGTGWTALNITLGAVMAAASSQEQGNDHFRAGSATCGQPPQNTAHLGPRLEGWQFPHSYKASLLGFACPVRSERRVLETSSRLPNPTLRWAQTIPVKGTRTRHDPSLSRCLGVRRRQLQI